MSASSAYAEFRYDESIQDDPPHRFLDVNKRVVVFTDTNNLNYSTGQINFDLNGLVNSKEFFDPSASWFEIPVTIRTTLAGGVATFVAAYQQSAEAASLNALKNAYASIISGVSIMCNGQSLENNQPTSNIPLVYRLLKMYSQEDVFSTGTSSGIATLEPGSRYAERGANKLYVAALGVVDANPPGDAVSVEDCFNGADQRKSRVYNSIQNKYGTTAGPVTAGYNLTDTDKRTNAFYAPDTSTLVWEYLLTIPLSHTHHLWEQMKLIRGAYWQIVLNTHLPCGFTRPLTTGAAAQVYLPVAAVPTNIVAPQQFLPFNQTPLGPTGSDYQAGAVAGYTSQAMFAQTAQNGTGTMTTTMSIQHATVAGANYQTGLNLKNCTINCVMYDLAPEYAEKYVANPSRTIAWNSCLVCRPSALNPVQPNMPVSVSLTSGQAYLKYLLIVPYNLNLPALPQTLSPYSEWGSGSYAPYASMTQLQVSLSGRPIFDRAMDSQFLQYYSEQEGAEAINGNGMTGLKQGMTNFTGFGINQTAVWINLQHHMKGSDGIPTSVDLSFKNNNSHAMGYWCYLIYGKKATFNVLTGQVSA